MLLDMVINEISRNVNPKLKHNDTVGQIEQVFRRDGFYTTRVSNIQNKRRIRPSWTDRPSG